METYLFWIVPIASLLALVLAWYFYKQMMLESEGTPTMEKIASYVRQGAMSYLKQQYKVVGLVFLGLVILFSIMAYGFNLQNPWVPIAFLTGGFFSGLSGFLGMKTATYASARTANAAQHSLNKGLRVASVAELLWGWSLSAWDYSIFLSGTYYWTIAFPQMP